MEKKLHSYLCRSFYLNIHPVLKRTAEYRERYLNALTYVVKKYGGDAKDYEQEMLKYYSRVLCGKELKDFTEKDGKEAIKRVCAINLKVIIPKELKNAKPLNPKPIFNRKDYLTDRYIFFIDCCFICAFLDAEKAERILKRLKEILNDKGYSDLDSLYFALYKPLGRRVLNAIERGASFGKDIYGINNIFKIWREQKAFFDEPVKTILVTACISAGKSTLINAIVGKRLVRSKQNACTSHISRIYNKSIHDNILAVNSNKLKYDVNFEKFREIESAYNCEAALYFNTFKIPNRPVCILDTPGVNNSKKSEHEMATKKEIKNNNYDLLLYVLNGQRLGTTDDLTYLKYISQNVPKEKTIFILNKVETYEEDEDSISESLKDIKFDLKKLGYKNPKVYPIAAYFALLIKLKEKGEGLLNERKDVSYFNFYKEKFKSNAYDLTQFFEPYSKDKEIENNEIMQLEEKSGIYALENILFGDEQ